MDGKEALKRLYNIACVQPGPVKEQFITYEKELEHNKTTKDLYDIIKQNLEILDFFKEIIINNYNDIGISYIDWKKLNSILISFGYDIDKLTSN